MIRQAQNDYWSLPALADDAAHIVDRLEAEDEAEAMNALNVMAARANLSGFFSVAMSASRAAQALYIAGISGALGSELITLAEELQAISNR